MSGLRVVGSCLCLAEKQREQLMASSLLAQNNAPGAHIPPGTSFPIGSEYFHIVCSWSWVPTAHLGYSGGKDRKQFYPVLRASGFARWLHGEPRVERQKASELLGTELWVFWSGK